MLYLIDASIYVFRAYFSLPGHFMDPQGRPVNAVYGYGDFLCGLLERAAPRWAASAFDGSLTTSFRSEIHPDYKANRALPPEDLERQLRRCRELSAALGMAAPISDTWEADDLIGSIAERHRGQTGGVTLVTADKDLAQLLREGDVLWDYAAGRRMTPADVTERFGVPPESLADLLALTGDTVDNIPGAAGIGPRTAAALIRHFGDLECLYAGLDRLADVGVRGPGRLRELLESQRETVMLSRRLTGIVRDAPVDLALEDLRWRGPDDEALAELLDALGFRGGRLAARLRALRPPP